VFAHDIHVWNRKGETRPKMKLAYWIHQGWFNFVGSLVGWLALFKLIDQGGVEMDWGDMATALVAVLGITGHLPLALYTIAAYGAGKVRDEVTKKPA